MVKFASALIFAALIAAPVLASSNWDDLNSRDLTEQDLFGRELTETEAVYAREVDELFSRIAEDLDARGVEYADLEQRSKIGRKIGNFFKKVWHGIKKVASVILKREDGEEMFTREEEIEARELDELFERYIQDIEERSPGFLHFMKNGMTHVKELAHSPKSGDVAAPAPAADSALEARGFEYLSARAFDDILEERDLDLELELAARDFSDDADLFGRDFFDDEDLFQRDFDEELFERAIEIDELD